MDHRIVDLHVHSTESDGTLTPEDLVAEAKKAGLAAFALTDHDTCQGVCKAMHCAASAEIELIPGIELSTDYHGKEKGSGKEKRCRKTGDKPYGPCGY